MLGTTVCIESAQGCDNQIIFFFCIVYHGKCNNTMGNESFFSVEPLSVQDHCIDLIRVIQ